jgi:hypothetical protein
MHHILLISHSALLSCLCQTSICCLDDEWWMNDDVMMWDVRCEVIPVLPSYRMTVSSFHHHTYRYFTVAPSYKKKVRRGKVSVKMCHRRTCYIVLVWFSGLCWLTPFFNLSFSFICQKQDPSQACQRDRRTTTQPHSASQATTLLGRIRI